MKKSKRLSVIMMIIVMIGLLPIHAFAEGDDTEYNITFLAPTEPGAAWCVLGEENLYQASTWNANLYDYEIDKARAGELIGVPAKLNKDYVGKYYPFALVDGKYMGQFDNPATGVFLNAFTMPDHDVTVTVLYKKYTSNDLAYYYHVFLDADGNEIYTTWTTSKRINTRGIMKPTKADDENNSYVFKEWQRSEESDWKIVYTPIFATQKVIELNIDAPLCGKENKVQQQQGGAGSDDFSTHTYTPTGRVTTEGFSLGDSIGWVSEETASLFPADNDNFSISGYSGTFTGEESYYVLGKIVPAAGSTIPEFVKLVVNGKEVEAGYVKVSNDRSVLTFVVQVEAVHDWENDYTIDKQLTCDEEGSKSIHCKHCDAVKDSTAIAPLGHDWSEWEVTKKATETEEGTETRTCRNDASHTETRSIPKKEKSVDPTVPVEKVVVDAKLPKVKIKTPKKTKTSVTVKWVKLSKKNRKKVQGIEVRITGRGTNRIVTAGKGKSSRKIKSLDRKKTYKVRVRTYKWINGVKHVSKWSKVRKVRTK